MVLIPAFERSRPIGNGINEGTRADGVYAVVYWALQK